MPAKPPTSGISVTGTGIEPSPAAISAWIATKVASPL
jgi:hypothetical protein